MSCSAAGSSKPAASSWPTNCTPKATTASAARIPTRTKRTDRCWKKKRPRLRSHKHNRKTPIMATDTLSPTLSADPIGEINKYDFRTESKPVFRARKGLDAEIVTQISEMKDE